MSPILVHYSLILDLEGHKDINATVREFLVQADLTKVEKSVETIGNRCNIRLSVEGPETLIELRQLAKTMPKGLFSEVTKAAIKNLKELPTDLYLELTARPPLFGGEDDSR